jgi:tyrosine decarboxylase/aspartate 1-decarboxylase
MPTAFPLTGSPETEVLAELHARASGLLNYKRDSVLGYPGTAPLDVALEAQHLYAELNPNNIMSHTHAPHPRANKRAGEKAAFEVTQQLEREVLGMLADLLGGDTSASGQDEFDGYIASGGTEANIMGLWAARNKLLQQDNVGNRGILPGSVRVIVALSAHYSMQKACNLLGIGEGSWGPCDRGPACETRQALDAERDPDATTLLAHRHNAREGGLALVGLDNDCRMDLRDVSTEIDRSVATGVTKFIIVATAGTTMTGAFDPIFELGQLLDEKEAQSPGVEFIVHVDAAFGGLVAPFLSSRPRFAFDVRRGRHGENPVVDSISVDPHKMGMVPYPAGVFLCRKGHQKHVERPVAYIASHVDDTILGSRPGSAAAACWAVFKLLGRQGFSNIVRDCMDRTYLLADQLGAAGAIVYPNQPTVNVLAAEFSRTLFDPARVLDIANEFHVVPEFYREGVNDCPRRVYRFTVMPHPAIDKSIERFLTELRNSRL